MPFWGVGVWSDSDLPTGYQRVPILRLSPTSVVNLPRYLYYDLARLFFVLFLDLGEVEVGSKILIIVVLFGVIGVSCFMVVFMFLCLIIPFRLLYVSKGNLCF